MKNDGGPGVKTRWALDERPALAQVDQRGFPAWTHPDARPADRIGRPARRAAPLDYFSIHVDEAMLN